MAPPPRNKRKKNKKKKLNGPPAGAVAAARENGTFKDEDEAKLCEKTGHVTVTADKESAMEEIPNKVVADVSSASNGNDSGDSKKKSGKKNKKRRSESEPVPAAMQDEEEGDTELVFEDPYGDEYETDDDEREGTTANGKNPKGEEIVDGMVANDKIIFRPGIDKLKEGETLVCDETAYDTLHRVNVEWPSMTLDVIGNGANGTYTNMGSVVQDTYPCNCTIVMGSQAQDISKNKLVFMKLSNMHRTRGAKKGSKKKRNTMNDNDDDSDDSDDDESMDDEDEGPSYVNEEGIIQNAEIKHDSTVNRVRVMPQHANIVAVWGESGRVSLFDAEPALDTLNLDNKNRMSTKRNISPGSIRPFYSYTGHRVEGYALDWSRVKEGNLLSGACNGSIYLWENNNNGANWSVGTDRFRGHRGSVEDIQWSPMEGTVFASCGVDKSIKFWDTRNYRKPQINIQDAHSADVNVISWNKIEGHLLVSGGDDGLIKVWDLRNLKQDSNESGAPSAEFKQHQKPITAVQWHPNDASMLTASSEDGTISIWDLAVERDAEEELREGVVLSGSDQYPPQLLFIHMGQKNTKEVMWHPSFTSLLVSTAEDGINVFKPSNITLPD